jgi:predicted ArsR family transcriptional regulator
MQLTRRRILNYLDANHLVTARELSRVFGMTAANIRHHLTHLVESGLVEVVGQRGSGGRGRPILVYGLTIKALGEELDLLADALLQELLSGRSEAQTRLQLRRIAIRMVGAEPDQGGNLTQRLYETVRRLQSMQYDAHWEAHAEGPRIILSSCPFAALKERHPAICQLDRQVLNVLLGETVEQVAVRSRTIEGPRQCIFQVDG